MPVTSDFTISDRQVAGRRTLTISVAHPSEPARPAYVESVDEDTFTSLGEDELVELGRRARQQARRWHELTDAVASLVPAGRGDIGEDGFCLDWVDAVFGKDLGYWPYTDTCSDLDALSFQVLPAVRAAVALLPSWSRQKVLDTLALTSASRMPSLVVHLDEGPSYRLVYRISKVELTGVQPDHSAEQIVAALAGMEVVYEHVVSLGQGQVTVTGALGDTIRQVRVDQPGMRSRVICGTPDELLTVRDAAPTERDPARTAAEAAEVLGRGLRA